MATEQAAATVAQAAKKAHHLQLDELRIAIVHDWLTNLGGAERVVLAMKQAFPQADLYTSVYNSAKLPQFAKLNVQTSFLQHWPLAKRRHQLYPTLRQLAFENFNWHDYDVVISSSTAEAKGIITPTEVLHMSYINTPTRYYWVDYEQYLAHPGFGPLNPIVKLVLPRWIAGLRRWDFAAAQRADVVIGNSANVRARIQKYYQRDSLVLHPPVEVSRFANKASTDGDYYLVVSRLIPYKRVDLAVEAFNALRKPLVVVGNGSELARLRHLAGPNIRFVTEASDAEVTKYYLGCRAFIFPTEEDFGITPLEAMAAGKPVICYGAGGAAETVKDGTTGVFFRQQTPSALVRAVERFENMHFDPAKCRARAAEFSIENFIKQLQRLVTQALAERG